MGLAAFPSTYPSSVLRFTFDKKEQKEAENIICVLNGDCFTVTQNQPDFQYAVYSVQVRHAQGIHNVESEKNHDVLMSPSLFDAQLSRLGWQQVNDLREHVRDSGILGRVELVITSPLSRTMETAIGVFSKSDESEKLPFLAVELCRERIGVHPCDKRRSIEEYKSLFPGVDFSLMEQDDDKLWTPDHRETPEEIAARGVKFMNWLRTRPEKEIAVVTHSVFLLHVLNTLGEDGKSEKSNFFKNCELRSMALVEGSNSEAHKRDSEEALTLDMSLKLILRLGRA